MTNKSGTEYGDATLRLVEDVLAGGARHLVLLMRHSAREFATDKHDLLNPLTDEGRELARRLGEKLPSSLLVRGYSSPAERCVETGDLILAGHADKGGKVTRNRPAEALGVFYILDQIRLYKAMQAAGGQMPLLTQWFEGGVGVDTMIPSMVAANLVTGFAASKLDDSVGDPQLDVLVSHDMTLYTVRDRVLEQPASKYGDVNFLDGIVLYRQDGQMFIRSQYAEARPLTPRI